MKLVLNLTENESEYFQWCFYQKDYLALGKLLFKIIVREWREK